jgi:sialic acid synthase SpsE
MVEKHFTTDKSLPGPDHVHSADTGELADMVAGIRTIEAGLGRPVLDRTRSDRGNAEAARRGLYAATDIPAGTVLEPGHIKCVRPERGLPPRYQDLIVGRTTRADLEEETPITFDAI